MQSRWKKFLWRHGLFTYARDSLVFFVNLFLWSQVEDLRLIALFNIVYLLTHTSMFYIGLPIIKAGRSQALMRSGLFMLALVLGGIVIAGDSIVEFPYLLAALIGFSNGAYWSVNHIDSFDLSNNKNRTSFFAYRKAVQGAAKLAVPAVGWAVFSVTSSDTTFAYNIIFLIAMVAMFVSWVLTDIPPQKESKLDVKGSLREFRRTKYFKLHLFDGFVYGLSLRSALASILLPFLIFQVVEREASLNFIQTLVEIFAVAITYYFARHKKNTDYITKLFVVGGASSLLGLTALFVHLSIETFILYIVMFVVALGTINVAIGTMSNNFVTTVKDYKDHRIEFLALREPAAIFGFLTGYIFVYFNPDLSQASLRPLLAAMAVATVLNMGISIKLWRYVQTKSGGK